MSPLPAAVTDLCEHFLALVPDGLVTGLYLHGGAGFGDWVPGHSDVDFLATVSHRPSPADLTDLRSVHEQLVAYSPIHFDGLYVLASDLAADPRVLPEVPRILDGDFRLGHLDELVAWHELAWHGATIAGPPLSELDIWTDKAALLEFTRRNIDTFWRAQAEEVAGPWTAEEYATQSELACTYTVLGAARLHHLLVTGEMTTKSRAGRWALTHYDERFHRAIREALRLRVGGSAEYADDAERVTDTAAFLAHLVETATGRPL